MKYIYSIFLLLIVSITNSTELNNNSVYLVDASWRTQNHTEIQLSALQGESQIIAFVYTYCEHTCPLILANIKQLLKSLPDEQRGTQKVTLISLDPTRDTPSQLKKYMIKKKLNEKQWTMLIGNPDDIRVLANIFNVKYKPMQNDELAHSNVITLLDDDGVILYQLKGLSENKQDFINAMTTEIKLREE